jgi:tRNA/rRNA methyltransferase
MTFDKPRHSPKPKLVLPIHAATRFVLVRPHYPENVGASARAIKTMGFSELWLVKPSKLAVPEHEMAIKMAVKSWDVLEAARSVPSVSAAVENVELVLATTSRRGSPVIQPPEAARRVLELTARGGRAAILFGNEKTGLSDSDAGWASACVRIPLAGDQPSINLAQAAQLIAYELFRAALAARSQPSGSE